MIALCSIALPPVAEAKVFHTVQEALALAFPEADRVEPHSFFLTEAQVEQVQNLAQAPVETKIITCHIGRTGQDVLGYAFIETHIVRTLPETFLIVVSPRGTVQRILTLAFYEPQEYLASERWIAQFDQRSLTPQLQVERDIHGIAGSTLTARAATRGIRKALALFQVLIQEKE